MKRYITLIFSLTALLASAGPLGTSRLEVRLGYNIGGTAPLGMPASIRHIHRFALTPSINVGGDATWEIKHRFGMRAGIHFENKGMDEEARVKNYRMELVKGGESLAGVFTGNVETFVTQWMTTVPVQMTYDLNNEVCLRVGPYVSMLTQGRFTGHAINGYLRVDAPTGAKVELGKEPGQRGDYDFSEHMRTFQMGVGAGVDWYFSSHFGLFGELNWGLTGVFKSGFHTVEQTLYPIYGAVGLTYKL